MKSGWLFGILAAIFLLFIGLYPQLKLLYDRDGAWQGSYAYNDLDENAYAAYVAALIEGRPRRNDPYSGRDDSPATPQPESLFSIQFLPAYTVAIPARLFGASASTALIFASALAAFFAALALFWLVKSLIGDAQFAAVAALFVLCCGVLAIGEGALVNLTKNYAAYPYFPFLRRYVPAVPFPIFFVFCAAVWQMLTNEKRRILFGLLAAACFTALVFSYFYLWTTAAAWLVCLAFLWLVIRPESWRRDVKLIAALGVLMALALFPYAILLSNRATTMDNVQLLVLTRMPDLLRAPEIWSLITLTLLSFAVWRKRIDVRDKLTVFTASLVLVPFAVFNQQILTGRSLQPIHYQVFIVNYVALLAFALAVFLLWRGRTAKLGRAANLALPAIALFAAVWGVVEAHLTITAIQEANVMRDQTKPVGNRLSELAKTELFDETGNRRVVLPLNFILGDELPTIAPQAVLWARHSHVFAGTSLAEDKERFFQFLYYAGVDERHLASELRRGNIVYLIALFGWGRHTARLTSDYTPLTIAEVSAEAQKFAAYRANFNVANAQNPRISYIVVDSDYVMDFTNIDRWHERDDGESVGDFIIYRVKTRLP